MKFKRFLERNSVNFELWAIIIWMVILIAIVVSLCSCSASYHYRKFLHKGGQIQCENGYTSDSNRINIIVPPAKWQIRLENKRFNDSLNASNKRHRDSLDNAYKIQKEKERSGRIETKEENKTDRKQIKEENKTDRVDSKQNGNTERTQIRQTNKRKSNWFAWILVGAFLDRILIFLYRKARDRLIRVWRK